MKKQQWRNFFGPEHIYPEGENFANVPDNIDRVVKNLEDKAGKQEKQEKKENSYQSFNLDFEDNEEKPKREDPQKKLERNKTPILKQLQVGCDEGSKLAHNLQQNAEKYHQRDQRLSNAAQEEKKQLMQNTKGFEEKVLGPKIQQLTKQLEKAKEKAVKKENEQEKLKEEKVDETKLLDQVVQNYVLHGQSYNDQQEGLKNISPEMVNLLKTKEGELKQLRAQYQRGNQRLGILNQAQEYDDSWQEIAKRSETLERHLNKNLRHVNALEPKKKDKNKNFMIMERDEEEEKQPPELSDVINSSTKNFNGLKDLVEDYQKLTPENDLELEFAIEDIEKFVEFEEEKDKLSEVPTDHVDPHNAKNYEHLNKLVGQVNGDIENLKKLQVMLFAIKQTPEKHRDKKVTARCLQDYDTVKDRLQGSMEKLNHELRILADTAAFQHSQECINLYNRFYALWEMAVGKAVDKKVVLQQDKMGDVNEQRLTLTYRAPVAVDPSNPRGHQRYKDKVLKDFTMEDVDAALVEFSRQQRALDDKFKPPVVSDRTAKEITIDFNNSSECNKFLTVLERKIQERKKLEKPPLDHIDDENLDKKEDEEEKDDNFFELN